ncbi:DUF262 domain-containing protein [Mesorhizobium sp. M0924]|uniref:DUF262 domain-containing protein n=1 Tax=unclassified Mesorhizobium TaxID=325217 RepID=UPI0033397ADA
MQLSPSDPDIQTIVARISNGDLDLQPDFQRGEVWSTQKKRRLIDSILRNWYIPPIHTVVVPETKKQDVLDGQQRLVAIRDFVNNRYPVDGHIQPFDASIKDLDGVYYTDLPIEVRRLFDNFTIRVMRVTDYKPEEPGELFFRLNAITNVTAAEQRNAFYGPVRRQVKELVQYFEESGNSASLGFSNSRMAYDDVLSKFLCTMEAGSLSVKLTANVVSDRFRMDEPFTPTLVSYAKEAITTFELLRGSSQDTKFNKATMLSWLIFCASFSLHKTTSDIRINNDFLSTFEMMRMMSDYKDIVDDSDKKIIFHKEWKSLFNIYSDRSTSRVLDISSVVLRDFVIHFAYLCATPGDVDRLPINDTKKTILVKLLEGWGSGPESVSERNLEKLLTPSTWGRLL